MRRRSGESEQGLPETWFQGSENICQWWRVICDLCVSVSNVKPPVLTRPDKYLVSPQSSQSSQSSVLSGGYNDQAVCSVGRRAGHTQAGSNIRLGSSCCHHAIGGPDCPGPRPRSPIGPGRGLEFMLVVTDLLFPAGELVLLILGTCSHNISLVSHHQHEASLPHC